MKYYVLKSSNNPKIIGNTEPVETYLPNEDWKYWSSDSFITFPQEGTVNFNVKFPIFKLQNSARVTDLLRDTNTGFRSLLISDRLFNCIRKFKLDENQAFDVKLLLKEEIITYKMVFFTSIKNDEYINFEESIFRQECNPPKEKNVQYLSFNNSENYWKNRLNLHQIKSDQSIKVDVLKLKNGNINHDIFRLDGIVNRIIVSEIVKNEILSQDITGIEFIDLETYKE